MKYICGVCGFEYDESAGALESGIAPGTKWEDIPDDWTCPQCGANKEEFEAVEENNTVTESETEVEVGEEYTKSSDFSAAEISVLFSNLAKGAGKQFLDEEKTIFRQLSEYYQSKTEPVEENQLGSLMTMVQNDLDLYPQASSVAVKNSDRGALRSLVWGEKVSKILGSIIKRYETHQDALLENTKIHVCEICGFTYIGDETPDICPVCKVQKTKISEIKRRS